MTYNLSLFIIILRFDLSDWKIEDGNKLIQQFTGNWFEYDTISE